MGNVVSSLVVRLVEQVTGPAAKAAAALTNVGKAAGAVGKSAAGTDKVAKSIKEVSAAAKGLNVNWSQRFTGEINKLALSADKLKEVKREWRDLVATINRKDLVKSMPRLDAWEASTLASLRKVKREAGRVQGGAGGAPPGTRWASGGARWAIGALGVGGSAYLANRAGRAALSAGAGNERESARDYLAGLSSADTARLKARSLALSRQYPSVDSQVMHQSLRETATSMRSVDKALEIGETLARGLVVLQSLKGKDEALKESAKFFSALDTLGKNLDPVEVGELYHGYLKALGVEGVDLNLADLKLIAQKSKSAGPGLSNRFMMMTAPGLQGDMSASRLGTALGSGVAQIIGDRATKKAKAAQAEFGLRDEKGWKDQRKIMTDPDKFAWENLIPALQKKGIEPEDIPGVTKAMNQIFSNQVVADLFTKMITQRGQYQGKSEQYEGSPGLKAATALRVKDPYVALEGLMAQLRNAASQLVEGPLQRAVPLLNSFTDSIGALAAKLAESPVLATAAALGTGAAGVAGGVGALALARKGYQWFTGSGAAAGGASAGTAAAASRWGLLGRYAARAPLWTGGRVMDGPDTMLALQRWRARQALPKDKPGYWGDGASGFIAGQENPIWSGGTNPVAHLDQSAAAGSAGAKTAGSYKDSFEAELRGVDQSIQAAMARWGAMLGSFHASPTITPNISAPAGGGVGRQSSVSDMSRKLARRIDDHLIGNFTDTEYG